MFVIVALVVVGVVFVVGGLLGVSVAQSTASDRARRVSRDRRLSALRTEALITQS
jgi:Tfp pilus assembly protein PilX